MLKSKTIRRDWRLARAKVEDEGCCRVCGSTERLEAAHTVGRAKQDVKTEGPRGGELLRVNPDSIVALCGSCHFKFDAHGLDLLAYLDLDEQLNAVRAAGGIYLALVRLCPSEYGRGA